MNIPRIRGWYRSGRSEIVALRAFSKADLERSLRSTRNAEERTW